LDPENLPHDNNDSSHALSEPEAVSYMKEFSAAVDRAKAKLTDKQRHALGAFLAGDPCPRANPVRAALGVLSDACEGY